MSQDFKTPQDALAHFGVKGMKWGQRQATIKRARQAMPKIGDATAEKEQAYLKARNAHGLSSPKTKAAHDDLQKAYIKEIKNDRTANTWTRGEQAALVLLTGPIGLGVVGLKSFADRDSRAVKTPNIEKMLKNIDPED